MHHDKTVDAGHVVLGPDDGEQIGKGPAHTRVLATAQSTNGRFTVTEATLPPGFRGPPPHTHAAMTDSMYVLEGTLTVRVGGDVVDAPAGTYVCVPPGTVHTFSNRSGASVRVLNINSPGGWEHYLRELARLLEHGAVTPHVWGDLMARHDFVPTGDDEP